MNPLIILGAGGFARETLDVVDAINAVSPTWDMLGFLVDPEYAEVGKIIQEKPILGDLTWLADHPEVYVVCGVGAPEVRYRMIKEVEKYQVKFATLIHPSAITTRHNMIGSGSVITAGCVLANQIKILTHVHINRLATVGHDVVLFDFVSIAPGVNISGNVIVNEGAYIGTGASIIEKKTIGAWSIVGAGSTVIEDVPPNTTVVGSPARVIKQRPAGWHLT